MAVEKVELVEVWNTRKNVFNVPQRQWRKWPVLGRQVFNEVYTSMTKNQEMFLHPKQEKVSRSHWKTTAWNAAWTAASAIR
jgi:hypothetical protein